MDILGFFSTERKLVQCFQHAYDQTHNVAAKYPVLSAHCFNSSLLIHLTQILKLCSGSPTQNLHGLLTQKRPPASINSFYIFLSKPHHSRKMRHLWQALILAGTPRERWCTHRQGGQRTVHGELSKALVDPPGFNTTVNKEVIRTDSTPLAIRYLIMQQARQQACWIGFKMSYMAQWSHNPHYTRPGTSLLEFTPASLSVSLTVFSLNRTYWSHLILPYVCFKEILPL